MTKSSPALMEGTRPSDPTNAAAASLLRKSGWSLYFKWWHIDVRQDVAVEVRGNQDVVNSSERYKSFIITGQIFGFNILRFPE